MGNGRSSENDGAIRGNPAGYMELKWLEDLLVLLEEKSVTRAAARRHVTQPAFSRRIRQLEQWLGAEIVDRSTKPVSFRQTGLALEGEYVT